MPNIGAYHPIIVHFAIALLVLGVIFRWVSLTGRAPFTGPAAATCLLLGAAAAFLAVHSGTDAHGPVAAQQARAQHDSARAATLFTQLEREFPNDTNVRLLSIESLVRDRDNARAALTALARFPVSPEDRRLQLRIGFLKADAYVAAGKPDSARVVLQRLGNAYPDMQARINERLKNVQ